MDATIVTPSLFPKHVYTCFVRFNVTKLKIQVSAGRDKHLRGSGFFCFICICNNLTNKILEFIDEIMNCLL